MSLDSTTPQISENGNGGNKRTPCPLYGCKRVYTDISALESHVKDHEIPAQSLPGKVLLCSTVGCSGSFPSMQKLMEHMRHHHKPNVFFMCENCRTKLRSYRGLLTHLHTCSKVPRGKPKLNEPTPLQQAAGTNANIAPIAMNTNPTQLDAVSPSQQLPSHIPDPQSSFPAAAAAVSQPDPTAPPLLGPPHVLNLEMSSSHFTPPQATEEDAQALMMNQASSASPSLSQTDVPDLHGQHQPHSPEPLPLSPSSGPHSPPVAVWKKNQVLAYSRRILWEHTKGCYTCVQCGHIVNNRKDMTHHINTYHSGNKPAEDTGSHAT